MITVALAGNPNCGKTTIFNGLTGTNQHVGNWPGVTVEKKEGKLSYKGIQYNIVDLPGTYSLGAYSEDEVVARDYILKDKPDIVVNVVDATNIERNLYLTTQLAEMGVKMIIVLNMMDEGAKKGIKIDIYSLSKQIGIPIVSTVASQKRGLDDLKARISGMVSQDFKATRISYGKEIDDAIAVVKKAINQKGAIPEYPADWLALKLLEDDKHISDFVGKNNPLVLKAAQKQIENLTRAIGLEPEMVIVDKRYEYVANVIRNNVIRPKRPVESMSDKIDKVLTHKWWGLPIFAVIMFFIYQLTFVVGEDVLGGSAKGLMEFMGKSSEALLQRADAPELLVSFVADGVFGGVGAVVEFVPLIMVLYLLLGILEDSGYMARAAYVMDGIMRSLGLHGKTFVSMLIGVGCNVPGVMSARTLDNRKDRMIAILINPFVSCGARLPIYLLFISAFFPRYGGLILFILYATGFVVAILAGNLLGKTLFRGETSYFIMELPPYRMPTLKGTLIHMWFKVEGFLKQAGTVIFAVVTMLWVLSVLPYGVEPYSEASLLGQIGSFISPVFRPAGFGTWQASVGLFAGVVAKEAVVATLGMVYSGVGEGAGLMSAIQQAFTPLSAFAFMVMTLLYIPCAATMGAIRKETNSWGWTLFSVIYTFSIGWTVSVLVYQIGRLLGFS